MNDVPIPFSLSKNDRDRRGLPIPYIVYRDASGIPHFTVDDIACVQRALARKLCGLCGSPLKMGQMWLIGGPASAFQDDGIFTSPHAHEDCARYAIQVCPFLAAPVYSRLIEAKTLKKETLHEAALVHHDQITPPRPCFLVLARTSGIRLVEAGDGSGKKYILPRRPWKDVEFWKNGKKIGISQAHHIAEINGLPPDQLRWWPAPGASLGAGADAS